ncbi:LysE family translocator [Acidipropionibacterium jensenii]|uniref:LysE family translocator n=1 Tax=Acidipropionibacterium jensenii TaxID=1749 RepID=UPI000BC359CA|nr:LysE family translocator [Acidipropionibacterium jensenii]AZZ41831.1 LysE family translocator [Acidipropionibacterium jensenii]
MIPAGSLLAYIAAAALLSWIPGPSVLFIVGRSIAHGRRTGLLTVLGTDLGLLVLALAVAFGVGPLMAASETAYWVIKFVGAGYLIHLGVQTIRHRRAGGDGDVGAPGEMRALFGKSFVVGVTNPKTLAICTALFPQFVVRGAGPVPLQLAIFAVIFWILAMTADCLWALASGTARAWFARSPRRQQDLAAGGGVLMIGLGGILALTHSS